MKRNRKIEGLGKLGFLRLLGGLGSLRLLGLLRPLGGLGSLRLLGLLRPLGGLGSLRLLGLLRPLGPLGILGGLGYPSSLSSPSGLSSLSSLSGPRGPRGPRGLSSLSSPSSPSGPRGLRGLSGPSSPKGLSHLSYPSPLFLPLLLACLLFAGCESDPIEPAGSRQRTTMELMSFSNPFLEIAPWSTRAEFDFPTGYQANHLPDGYQSYEELHPHASMFDSTIGVFMTPDDINPTDHFIYQGLDGSVPPVSIWKSSIVVEKDKTYYIYGFMPKTGAETANITSLNGTGGDDYANGAVISIQDYDALTTADVSVIVGLRWASEMEKINGIAPDGSDVPLGHFTYVGQDDGDNRLFILLKHIYAGLHFATMVDPVYHKLRTIRITKVELTALNISETVDVTITLAANNTGTDPMTSVNYISTAPSSTNKTIVLYEKKTDDPADLGEEVPADTYKDFLGCLVPGSTNSFTLKTTYDVYDTNVTPAHPEGNLIRKDCVAVNAINPNLIQNFPNLQAGELFTVNLLIKPTYLYVLSDPDLDNPTITIQ